MKLTPVYSIFISRNWAVQYHFYHFLAPSILSAPSPFDRGNQSWILFLWFFISFQYSFTECVLVIHKLLFCVFHILRVYSEPVLAPHVFLFPWHYISDNYSCWGMKISFINFHYKIIFYSVHIYIYINKWFVTTLYQ